MSPVEKYDAYIRYISMKIEQKDWHAVADAAMDLRELEARYPDVKQESKGLWRHTE